MVALGGIGALVKITAAAVILALLPPTQAAKCGGVGWFALLCDEQVCGKGEWCKSDAGESKAGSLNHLCNKCKNCPTGKYQDDVEKANTEDLACKAAQDCLPGQYESRG